MDWYPWGEEALARAREEDRPILLSIGYSACHWCHVMERESFEDAETAALMNERFVCIKLDREERPDLDSIYMEACQAMTGQGGWPLNVFLTPEQVPFFAGTYFPPDSRMGMPSWRSVLEAVAKAWDERRDEIREGGSRIAERLRGGALLRAVRAAASTRARSTPPWRRCARQYDRANGGFGGAPKFPPASALEFLLRRGETEMTAHTLRAMASGGMYDQVGGGFARYSVDPYWLVPHFEKMLYDNALLARAYLHGWQVTGDPLFRDRRRGDARLGAARDARARGRLLLGARRRLRGRGGQVLRLDASRSCAPRSTASPTPTRRSPGSAPPTAATSRAGTSRCAARASPSAATSGARRLYDVRAAARLARARRQAAHLLERADDLGARRRRRGARARRLPGRRPRRRRVRAARAARRGRAAAAHLEGRRGAS